MLTVEADSSDNLKTFCMIAPLVFDASVSARKLWEGD